MAESWDESTDLPAEVRALHGAILDLRVTQDTIERRVAQFRRRIRLDGYLPACGSCGIRHCFVDEDELDHPKQRSREDEENDEDFFHVKPEPPPFSRLSLDDPLIQTLRLNDDQIRERNRNKFKHIFCAYEDIRDSTLKATFHLHPLLIERDPDGGAPRVAICCECLSYMRKKLRQNTPKKPRAMVTEQQEQLAINRTYCIAEGYDFGHLDHTIPSLSILECILISQYVFYGTLVKLNAWKGVRQNALKGHIIAFKHSGPNVINRVSTLLFPWYDRDEVLGCVKVSFVGPRGIADRCLKALCLDGGLLRVDIKRLAIWLELLQACHPGYKHLQLPSQAQHDEIRVNLLSLQAAIIANSQRVHSKLSRHIEGRAGADIAAVRSLPEDHDADEDEDNLSSDLSDSSDSDDDDPDRMVDCNDPDLEQKLNFILSDAIIVDGALNAEASDTDLLGSLLAMMRHNPDAAEPPAASVRASRGEEPVSEMGNTDILYYMALPTLFPFGRGLPEGSYALPSRIVRHLLLQYHNRHASDQRFCFSQFNMMQRHAACRSAALRVRNSKPLIQEFMSLIREDTFQLRLQMAVETPDSDDAKMLARQILPLVTTMGSSIPYSPSERKDMFSRFVSSMYMFGTGFLFASAAFDDRNHVFAVRLATPSTSNTHFPARDAGLMDNMHHCKETFQYSDPNISDKPFNLKIDNVALLKLVSESPVAAVQFFKTLFQAFLDILLAIPPPSQLKEVPLHHHSRRGLYGIVTDISLVHETSGRGSLHFHSPLTGVLNPYLLQTVLHSPMFAQAISQVYDSIVKTELPATLHIRYLLERYDPSLITSRRNYAAMTPDPSNLEEHSNLCAFYKNIHSSHHTDSCVNKFLPYCRYCKGSVLAPVSGGRLVIPKDNGKDQTPRYTFDVAPVPEPDPYREDLFGSPVQPIDCRPISFEIKRRHVALLDPADSADIPGNFDLADCLNSDILKDLDPELKNAILNLSSEQRASLRDEIVNHNQWCTEWVPAPMACLACNTAVYPMGLGTSAKSIFVYCCLYLVKNSAAVLSIVSLLHDAKVHCDKYPSLAIDSGTEHRSTIQLLTRMLNNLSSSSEYSGTQACATALGLSANFCMHNKCYLFADRAIEYIRDHRLRLSQPELQPDDQPSDMSSFSSGVYSMTPSEASSDPDEPFAPAESDLSETRESNLPSETGRSGMPDHAGSKGISLQSKSSVAANPIPPLSEDDEFGPVSAGDDGLDVSDTDSDNEVETHQRIESLLRRGASRHGSIPLMRNAAGKLCIVQQAEDYLFRHNDLLPFSLYEMVCTTYRREIARRKKKDDSSDSDPDEPADAPRRAAGRQPDTLFHFQGTHQLKETHALTLLKKYSVAHFIKKVPAYPGTRPFPLTEAWKSRARIFAEFIMVVFKPWQGPDGLPSSTTWHSFCMWMSELRQSDSILSRTRAAFVRNAAHNLKFSSSVSKLLKRFRGSAATRWLEMALHLRPKKWLYGDEIIVERNLKSKNSQREAELAIQDLLHRVCHCSPTETKKGFLITHTIDAYKSAISPKLGNLQSVHSLFREGVPELCDRINCFSVDAVEKVRDHNLRKQADRILRSKLKSHKHPGKTKQRSSARPASPPPSQDSVLWSPQQQAIVNAVSTFLDAFVDWKNGHALPPNSLSILIFGGPGVGKTTVLKQLSSLCKDAGMPLLSSAATGVAAGAMHQAGTNHSRYALPVFARGETDSQGYLPPLGKTTVRLLIEEFEDSLSKGWPLAIAIDEVSMLSALTLGRILQRISEFEAGYFDDKNLPPRLFILVGDFFQIPPCRAIPLYITVLNNALFKIPSPPGGPEDVAYRFFKSFRLFHLDVQYRSLDRIHSENLSLLRTCNPTIYPFTRSLLSQYKKLSYHDVCSDPFWLVAPVVVLFNQLRHAINLEALKVFAISAGFPIICWRNLLHGASAALLTPTESTQLYSTHPALSGFFVPGAPCYGKTNTNTYIGLFNGTRMKQYSVVLDSSEDSLALAVKLRAAHPGELVLLQHPPFSVQMEIIDAQSDTFTEADTLLSGKYVIPIMVETKSQYEVIKPWELLRRQGSTIHNIKYRSHGFDLGFSLTYEKVQSKSFQRLILDLQSWPKMQLTAEKVLVGLSRVSELGHVRIIEFAPGQTDQHLFKLKPNELMLHWVSGFDAEGNWSAQHSANSIAKHPLSTKKRTSGNNSGKADSKSQSVPNTSSSAPSKKSADLSKFANTADTTSISRSIRVVSQFRLNLAHAPPLLDPSRLYHSFEVPGDGHCLFHSFLRTLHLQTRISELRLQMIQHISNDQSPMRRLSALNAHISREQEHFNPAWMGVDLLDAGTDLSPGVMDDRFCALWIMYSDEMGAAAWAGQPEIMALSDILGVNCIVWEVKQGYAQAVFRHLHPHPIAEIRTVHLHYASRRHYEYTDIPKDFVPPQVLPHDYRRSSRQRRPRVPSP